MVEEAVPENPLIPQLLAIARRRKWSIVIPFLLIAKEPDLGTDRASGLDRL